MHAGPAGTTWVRRKQVCCGQAPGRLRLADISSLATLLPAQDWLYDEGEDEKKSVYMDKLSGLRGAGDAIETRYVEAGVRKPAAEKLRGTANAYLTTARSTDARYAHIDAADKKKVGCTRRLGLSGECTLRKRYPN